MGFNVDIRHQNSPPISVQYIYLQENDLISQL